MKVTGFNGSPRKNGNTSKLVKEILKGAEEAGAKTKAIEIGNLDIKGCKACYHCRKEGICKINDDMQNLYQFILSEDPIIIGSPVYMFQMTGQTKTFIDRFLPVFRPGFDSRIPANKKLVLVFTQGADDSKAFMDYFKHTANMLGFLGFKVVDILVATNTSGKDDILEQEKTLKKAREIGKKLVKK